MPSVERGFADPNLLTRHGPTVTVQVGYDPDFHPNSGSPPNLPTDRYHALVDTGAGECCIDSALAERLQLPIVDQQSLSGAHGPGIVNIHLAQLHVPDLEWTVYGRFAGVHLSAGGQQHLALIGRTLLRHHTLLYNGQTGIATLSRD